MPYKILVLIALRALGQKTQARRKVRRGQRTFRLVEDLVRRKAKPYLDKLRHAPLQLSNQAHELEIVPYERLVRLLAESLRKRRGRPIGYQFAQKLDRAVGVGL